MLLLKSICRIINTHHKVNIMHFTKHSLPWVSPTECGSPSLQRPLQVPRKKIVGKTDNKSANKYLECRSQSIKLPCEGSQEYKWWLHQQTFLFQLHGASLVLKKTRSCNYTCNRVTEADNDNVIKDTLKPFDAHLQICFHLQFCAAVEA